GAQDPSRAFELVVRAKPAVDVDGADGSVHARRLHDGHAPVNVLLGHLREFAVVHGNVAFAARRVGGAQRAGHGGLDLGQHLLHARVVGGACGLVLLVELVQPALRIAPQCHGAVLGHDGIHGPGLGKRLAPAYGAAGDRYHAQPGLLELGNGINDMGRHHAFRGQGVVDVGEDAERRCGRCPEGQRLEGCGHGRQNAESRPGRLVEGQRLRARTVRARAPSYCLANSTMAL
ncbi:hypothetical protein COLO4_01224, partial [Corchorus olitorius]